MSEGTALQVLAGEARWSVAHADAIDFLRSLPDESIDALVTDPPSGIEFMGRDWDSDKGGSGPWIEWLTKIMREVLRVLKPGAHGLVWALPRTSHWTGTALELAGFEVCDQIHHVFGSGFPKSLNVSKAIDERDFRAWLKAHPYEQALYTKAKRRKKALGADKGARVLARVDRLLRRRAGFLREVIGSYTASGNAGTSTEEKGGTYGVGVPNSEAIELTITRGATEKSREWDGYGTALKPSQEVWWLVQKPIRTTIAQNVLDHGTGALNIDGCRIGTSKEVPWSPVGRGGPFVDGGFSGKTEEQPGNNPNIGRWPANTLLTHDSSCRRVGTAEVKAHPTWDTPERECEPTFTGEEVSTVRHGDGETETVDVFECVEGCPVLEMDRQSGTLKNGGPNSPGSSKSNGVAYQDFQTNGSNHSFAGESGGASRYFQRFEWNAELDDIEPFFYSAKPSRAERDRGLEHWEAVSGGEATGREDGSAGTKSPRAGAGRNGGARNVHPTVKRAALMAYLCRLATPPGGVVLDPFAGSGSTAVGAIPEGFRFIGIEKQDTHEEPFVSIARARITHVAGGSLALPETAPLRPRKDIAQQSLFFGTIETGRQVRIG